MTNKSKKRVWLIVGCLTFIYQWEKEEKNLGGKYENMMKDEKFENMMKDEKFADVRKERSRTTSDGWR